MRGSPTRARMRAWVAGVLAATMLWGAPLLAQEPLHVLLTNDDGFDAPGLAAMHEALAAQRYRVTVVAPVDDRSWSGSATTASGTIDYYEQAEGVWAVDGTPSDAVSVALVHILRNDPPDVVISGLDFGHNVGENLIESATVGAALTASRSGIPAIAASVATDFGEADRAPPFRSTTLALEPAAAFVTDVLRQLRETDAEGLLPPRRILNLNYPAIGQGSPRGTRFATVASVRGVRRVYAVGGPTGPARVELAPGDDGRAEGGSDFDLLADDFVTISVLSGVLDAGPGAWEPLYDRLVIER